ncbi:MAG: phosphatidate cytidylyltransferase [Clostridiales bacterium]|nr:phosphatidate cytidylyltransferase [Clostridiales bacterium]
MKQRVITAFVLLLILAFVVWQINTPVFAAVIAFLSAVAANEIMKCAKVKNKFILYTGTVFAAFVPFFSGSKVMEPLVSAETWGNIIYSVPNIVYIIAVVLIFFLAMLKGYSYTKFEDVTVSVFASVIVPFGFSVFVRLRDMYINEQFGIYLIFFALICALGTDSGAQLGGMAFGKHKMSPNISPKKTVEGAACGIIFSLILNAVAFALYNYFADAKIDAAGATVLLVCSVPVSFMGMMGDLSASVLKRNFKVKDFGKIFPGHGGVMDRFDSVLFTLPVTYAMALVAFTA